MAFSSVTTGSGADYESWFAYDEYRAQVSVTITSDANHLSPSTGTMLCVSESINSSVSGGSMRYFLSDVGGGNFVDSATFDPAGTGNTTSARYSETHAISKAMVAGTTYWVGIVEKTGTAIGFLTTASGSDTYLRKSDWTVNSSWAGTLYTKTYYNTVPSKPATLTATSGTALGSVNLSWGLPSNDGHGASTGAAVNGYKIQWSTVANFATIAGQILDTASTTRTRTITRSDGLNPGTRYYFRVAALNDVSDVWGGGASSPYNTMTTTVMATAVGRRFAGSAETPIATAVRWNGTAEVPITVMKRWDGTKEVDLGGV